MPSIPESLQTCSYTCNHIQQLSTLLFHNEEDKSKGSVSKLSSSLISILLSDFDTPAIQSQLELSDSDTNDAYTLLHMHISIHLPDMPTLTSVIHSVPKQVLILMTRDITSEILIDWFNACENYFTKRDTSDEKRIAKVLGDLQDILFKDWYNPDRTCITALSWAEFIKEAKSKFLSLT